MPGFAAIATGPAPMSLASNTSTRNPSSFAIGTTTQPSWPPGLDPA